jgi:hypothetical protein
LKGENEMKGDLPRTITLDNIKGEKIIYRNFSGKGNEMNTEGNRNFCVRLDPDDAEDFKRLGFNVKTPKPNPKYPEEVLPEYIQVKVNYNGPYPPLIFMVTSKNKTVLDEHDLMMLDVAEIDFIDLIISPSIWKVGPKNGVAAYAKKMYVNIVENEFEKKYQDIPDSGRSRLEEDGR